MTDTYTAATVLALAGVGLLLVPDRPRLATVTVSGDLPGGRPGPAWRALLGAAAFALAGLALAPGWWWLVVPAAGVLAILLVRASGGSSPARRAADRRFVAVYAELLASCLDAGMAVAPALRAVSGVLADGGSASGRTGSGRPGRLHPARPELPAGRAAPGPLAILDAVAAMLSLGADPRTAWRMADLDDLVAPLAAAARRSAAGGSALADAVREHADQLRQESAAASIRSAGRAGVLMTAPLGVCFLPAFLCLGLAPVVIGLLGQLHIF